MIVSLLLFGIATPAMASPAPAAFIMTVTPGATTAVTGTSTEFTIGYTCSGVTACEGVTIRVPLPSQVAAREPNWGYQWWKPVTLTTSGDVATSSVAPDGEAVFSMKTLTPGTTGTLGVHYTPTTLTTPNGTKMTVVASAQGSTVDSSSASASATLTTASTTVTSAVQSLQSFNYLDQDVQIAATVEVQNPFAVGADGIEAVSSFALTLPTGAELVAAAPAHSSMVGDVVTWEDLPKDGSWFGTGRHRVELTVRFPSSSFSDRQEVTLSGRADGASISGVPFSATASLPLMLEAFEERVQPHVQVTTSNYNHLSGTVARGATYSFGYYLNNYNSTIPATRATLSSDIAPGVIPSRMSLPGKASLMWTSSSGATGTVEATEESRMVQMAELGMPSGDALARFAVELGAVEAPGSREFNLEATTTDPAITQVAQCAVVEIVTASDATASANGCGRYQVVDPFITPRTYLNAPTTNETYRPGDTIAWQASAANANHGNHDWAPSLTFVAPTGTKAAETPFSWAGSPTPDYATPTVEVTRKGLNGQDLVRVTWPDSPALKPGDYLEGSPQFHTTVTTAPAGSIEARLYAGDARGPIPLPPYNDVPADSTSTTPWTELVTDDRGILPGGTARTILARSAATVATGTGASLQSILVARGSLDSGFVSAPQRASTESGKPFEYSLLIRNTGNVPLEGTAIYNVLPFIGDTGVSEAAASQPRGSQFSTTLQGPVSAPVGFTVEYSLSSNPCRPEVHPSATDCVADWAAAPSDYAAVRALRFVQNVGERLAPGDEVPATWSMSITPDGPAGGVAYNSVAFSATRTDNGRKISAEPTPIGVEIARVDLKVALSGRDLAEHTATPLSLIVSNSGPSAGQATAIVSSPDARTLALQKYTGDHASDWTCTIVGDPTGGQSATCVSTERLSAGYSGALPLLITAGAAGTTGTITASVTGSLPESDPRDNVVTADFRVVSGETLPHAETPTPTPTPTPIIVPGADSPDARTGDALASTGLGNWIPLALLIALLTVLVGARLHRDTSRTAADGLYDNESVRKIS